MASSHQLTGCGPSKHLFNGKNYSDWAFRMKVAIEEKELEECIKKPPTEDMTGKLKKKYLQCKLLLVDHICDDQLEYVKDKKSSYDVWLTLKEVFGKSGLKSQLYLRKQLLNMKLPDGGSMEKHFLAFDKIIRELNESGAQLHETDIICHLLLTLPSKYNTVVTVIESLPDSHLNLNLVKRKLLDEEMSRQQQKGEHVSKVKDEPNLSVFHTEHKNSSEGTHDAGKSRKPRFKCYKCGRMGHKKSECKVKFTPQNKSVNYIENNDVTFMVSTDVTSDCSLASSLDDDQIQFIVDSGATDHLVNDDSYFNGGAITLKNPITIAVAKECESLNATKVGTIITTEGKFSNVLFVPNLRHNLLSVKRLESNGFGVKFDKGKISIFRDGKVYIEESSDEKMYTLLFTLVKANVEANALFSIQKCQELWHRRLGHASHDKLKIISKQGLLSDLDSSLDKSEIICETCIKGKQTRSTFKSIPTKTKRVLELVHTDLCGPISPVTHDSKKYVLTFLDDYSHFCVIYLLESKSDVPKHFKEYIEMVTAQFYHGVSRLRCDNGKEFMNKEIMDYCKSKGIQIEPTIPYTPENNGKAERLNRTLLEKARVMISEYNLARELWGEAIFASAYIINRLPTVDQKIPAFLWYGTKPDYTKFKVFGSIAYLHVPKEKRDKLDDKSIKCRMVGYCPNGYRLWDIEGKQILRGRDIIFDESPQMTEISDNPIPDHDIQQDEVSHEETPHTIAESGSNSRTRKRPGWLEDYDTSYLALNTSISDEPSSFQDAMKSDDKIEWLNAMKNEMEALDKNKTWTLVKPPPKTKVIDCKWVFKEKMIDNKVVKHKARLVAKGFQQKYGVNYEEVYAPVARMSTIRTLLSVAVNKSMHVHTMDVKTAFLNGNLEDTVYMKQPEGFSKNPELVCKLNKSLYGLKQSSREWNKVFHDYVLSLGFKQCLSDNCLYILNQESKIVYLLLYVDDITIVSEHFELMNDMKLCLSKKFEMEDLGEIKHFLGLNIDICYDKNTIIIHQKPYIDKILTKFNMTEAKGISTPIEKNLKLNPASSESEITKKPYRELIGCLMYLLNSRPDICFALNYFARFQDKATDEHWTHLKRILRYLKETKDNVLIYNKQEGADAIIGFADADWGADPVDRKSCFTKIGNTYV
ncbi:hypothetical protein M8J77_010194 [Diaphorina citri]|nr:hypothetical protein M8J77_010194 [Diaphorina citri]